MAQHWCRGGWRGGPVASCPNHDHRGAAAVDVSPFDDGHRQRRRVEGVAASGRVSEKGTVTHTDYWSGRMAVEAAPATINVKLMDLPWFRDRFVYRDGKLIEKATGKEAEWTRKLRSRNRDSMRSRLSGGRRKPAASRRVTSGSGSSTPGVGIGNGGVLLRASNPRLSRQRRMYRN